MRCMGSCLEYITVNVITIDRVSTRDGDDKTFRTVIRICDLSVKGIIVNPFTYIIWFEHLHHFGGYIIVTQ